MFDVLTLSFVAFCLRLVVVINAEINYDTYGHLYFAKELKLQKVGPFGEIITNAVGAQGCRRPFLWHWMLGFFPIKKVSQFQKWINPGIDAIFAILIYIFALGMAWDKSVAALISLLYLLTPMWFSRISSGPRISSLTPRLASELGTNLFFILTLLPLGLPLWVVLISGTLFSAFVLLSSKFGLQAMLFLVPLTSAIAWDPVPISAFALGSFIAVGLTKGAFLNNLNEHFCHLAWYFKKNMKGETAISSRNSLSKLFEKPSSGGGCRRHVGVILLRILSHNSFTAVIAKMPILLVALGLYSFSFVDGTGGGTSLQIVAPVIAGGIIFFLISLPPLLFLGEPERYLSHVAFFIVAIAVTLAVQLELIFILIIIACYGFVYWFIESFFLHKLMPVQLKLKKESEDSVIFYLNSLKKPQVILSYPYQAIGAWRIMLETSHKVVQIFLSGKKFIDFFEENYGDEYPYVKLEKLDDMSRELGVAILIARKHDIVARGYGQWVPSGLWQKLDVGQPVFDVYGRVSWK